ncbi:hypothetical protein OPV22_023221 [Ensete ventricosum]|uniref:Uncharacterized protein n=1 Tax=Ensete ventricosum TaxID=4639 RepID=A0AAV8QHF4_ENSVE|nr:hypothetical protein OPV22_023221 [Ensete ventricosum]
MRSPCCGNGGNNKGAWSKEEDQKLIDYIGAHGHVCWRSLPKAAGLLRCDDFSRKVWAYALKTKDQRWINYLRADVKRGRFDEDEEDLHALLGNRWSSIAGRLPGRTDNEVKNYWNSHLRKKLASMGIDPDDHRATHNARLHRSHSSSNATRSSIDYATNGSGSDHLQHTASPTLLLFP